MDVPDDFALNVRWADGAEGAAVDGVGAGALHKEVTAGGDVIDALDQAAIFKAMKDDDIAGFQAPDRARQRGGDYKIAIHKFGSEAEAANFKNINPHG